MVFRDGEAPLTETANAEEDDDIRDTEGGFPVHDNGDEDDDDGSDDGDSDDDDDVLSSSERSVSVSPFPVFARVSRRSFMLLLQTPKV